MERFPGQLVIGGAIMVAGGAVGYGMSADEGRDGVSIIVLGVGFVITIMGILIGYFALKGAAEARESKH